VKENGYKKIGDAYTSTCKTINDGFNGWPTLNPNDLEMNNDGFLH